MASPAWAERWVPLALSLGEAGRHGWYNFASGKAHTGGGVADPTTAYRTLNSWYDGRREEFFDSTPPLQFRGPAPRPRDTHVGRAGACTAGCATWYTPGKRARANRLRQRKAVGERLEGNEGGGSRCVSS